MAKTSLTKIVRRFRLSFRRNQSSGFTLTELLVSMIIGAFLVVLLLSLVVELTQTNQQDAARSQVQQDMQAAMDYITQDLREAVFVYNGECLQGSKKAPPTQNTVSTVCPGIVNHIPAAMSTGGRTPVLAFWRTEPLPRAIKDLCSAQVTSLTDTGANNQPPNALVQAGVPCISGNSYSLVVYALDTSDSNLWQGKARIVRYKLSQFKDNATSENDQNRGYINPLNSPDSTFQQWPYGPRRSDKTFDNLQLVDAQVPGRPDNPAFALVDFVNNEGSVDQNACAEFAPSPQPPATEEDPIANALSPKSGAVQGFFACVRNGGMGAASGSGSNQDVLLSIVGNVTGQAGFTKQYDNEGRLTPLQTRVMVRGVINKANPQS